MQKNGNDSPRRHPLGQTGLEISPVSLGCWPIAGVTTLDTNEADSLATIYACRELGINHLDTAYVYGPNGESENLIAQAIMDWRDEVIIATKCGIHFEGKAMVTDARPETIRAECDKSLQRLGTDRVELYYLHGVDPEVPIEESAGVLKEIMQSGKAQSIGVCNVNVEQLERFQSVCPITAVQLPYNMLQRDVEQNIVPWCKDHGISVTVYWALMKGLLAGRLSRKHQFKNADSRRNYPMYQGEEWEKNQDFIGELRQIAEQQECTVAQLVVAWTLHQTGITSVLCGAKRAHQIQETAQAMKISLSKEVLAKINSTIAERGPAAGKRKIS